MSASGTSQVRRVIRNAGGTSTAERISIWGGGTLSMTALGLWVLSGRATGFAIDPVISASVATSAGLLIAAGALHALRTVGPIGTDAATTHWLISTPLDRQELLRGRILVWSAAMGGLGVLAARILALVAGATEWWPLAVIGAASGVLVVASTVLAQQTRRWASALPAALCALVLAAAAASAVPPPSAVWCAVVITVSAVVFWATASSRSGRIPSSSLTSGADLLAAGSAGLSFLDIGFVTAALETRAHRRRGAVHSSTFRRVASPPASLVWSDVLRHCRHRMLLGTAVAALTSVVAASTVLPPFGVGVVGLLSGYLTTSAASPGLRDVLSNSAIRRALALPDRTLVMAFLVVPSLAALAVAVCVGVTVSWWAGLVVGLSSVAAVVRSRTAPPRVYDGLAVVTMFGAIPVDVIRQMTRGPAILLVGAIVLLL